MYKTSLIKFTIPLKSSENSNQSQKLNFSSLDVILIHKLPSSRVKKILSFSNCYVKYDTEENIY